MALNDFSNVLLHHFYRGNWEIARREVNNPRVITMVSTDRTFLDPDFDEYEASASRRLMWCRSIAIILMVLLVLRHTLPIIANRAQTDPFSLLMLLLVRTLGIILPSYVIMKAVNALHHRRGQQAATLTSSDEAASPPILQHQHHIIRVH
ncbi:unnamed protein product [Ilex paraguariensis]|uniref:Uncharacterized protein n=1 Tax=Ilex paraguariensis TaxID=185542 RepID=A0ABC8RAR9_9AQUA